MTWSLPDTYHSAGHGRGTATLKFYEDRDILAFGGAECEIDLNKKNAAAFRMQLAPFIGHARKAGRAQPRRPGRTAARRQRSGEVRAWAKQHGLAVSERGRIPASVVEQYQTATGQGR
jgi:hypothetical protein